MTPFRLILACLLAITLVARLGAEAPTRGFFLHREGGREVKVWYYHAGGPVSAAPVVFVMHGVRRNGEDYLNEWVDAAAAKRFLLIVPEFSQKDFPGEEGYIYGNVVDAAGRAQPREAWSFRLIETIFDAVKTRFGNGSAGYQIYGHSAGAQFVHRFVWFLPEARWTRAVAANAGWYTLPDLATPFPYGLKDTGVDEAGLRLAFARPVTVLLGEADTDPRHPSLRRSPEADRQGIHRFDRGRHFFNLARATAARSNLPFHWSLSTAPGVAHSNKDMTPYALRVLFPD